MKSILFTLALFCGCSYTSIKSGDFQMRTQANMRVFDRKPDGSIHIEGMDHSGPTLAGGQAIGGASKAIGTAAAGLATVLATKGL